jgi:hypothetical protein
MTAMTKYFKAFVQNCLHCVATIPGEKVPRPLCTQLCATNPNEILHFDFLYFELSRDGKYQTYYFSKMICADTCGLCCVA